uniref:Ig-like domain-containing protein n=2 Tax=Pyxicephalus adspersus TaxID=30357 RepID=A0AAV2ZIX0_PYXAD|nr:TPA: hypothetical protein GDO54_003350 [Pyxicephalus adspersus]
MERVPTSITVNPGESARIPCNFHSTQNVTITWLLFQRVMNRSEKSYYYYIDTHSLSDKSKDLVLNKIQVNQSGLYRCQVFFNNKTYNSCGTYLRVKEPPIYLFFNVGEATKNRVITAEGILLLFCAIIPGTFLLYKKRFENLNSLSLKQSEGENLYEGLNLEDCSMYEDISRGLQATYEDVGSLRAGDIQLEKP